MPAPPARDDRRRPFASGGCPPLLMNPPKSKKLERHVFLSEAKDLLKRTRASQDEILRFAQDDVPQLSMRAVVRYHFTGSLAVSPLGTSCAAFSRWLCARRENLRSDCAHFEAFAIATRTRRASSDERTSSGNAIREPFTPSFVFARTTKPSRSQETICASSASSPPK